MLEDLSFEAPNMPHVVDITPQYVDDKLKQSQRIRILHLFYNINRRRKIMSLLSKTRELNIVITKT